MMDEAILSRLKEQIRRHEGVRLKPYRDTAGKLTIGIGHNLDDRGISLNVAERMLQEDLEQTMAGLARAMPDLVGSRAKLDPVRQAVLVEMGFNLGVGGLLAFKRTLEAVRERRFADAAREMLDSRWAGQVKGRSATLADEMRTGEWR